MRLRATVAQTAGFFPLCALPSPIMCSLMYFSFSTCLPTNKSHEFCLRELSSNFFMNYLIRNVNSKTVLFPLSSGLMIYIWKIREQDEKVKVIVLTMVLSLNRLTSEFGLSIVFWGFFMCILRNIYLWKWHLTVWLICWVDLSTDLNLALHLECQGVIFLWPSDLSAWCGDW